MSLNTEDCRKCLCKRCQYDGECAYEKATGIKQCSICSERGDVFTCFFFKAKQEDVYGELTKRLSRQVVLIHKKRLTSRENDILLASFDDFDWDD